ncbi:MAG: SusC/RagA family TonB-linked outer membrane protein [Prevotella sp.]
MKKRLTMLLVGLFACVGVSLAQTQVKGTVVSDEDGQPVIGAAVRVVGTNVGTVTDSDGKFSVTCPQGKKTLSISYVGMEPIEVGARANMRIILKNDSRNLDEIIVVAYGTAKKSAFTGSAAVVGSEELSKKVTTNVTDALVGSVAGLQLRGQSGQPGSDNSGINIRGIASMYAATDPLVIVDGAPYPGNLSSIPSEDIESVSVLKDAASAALYGARGAAGVIIITTKDGKNREAEISVDMKWGANSRAVQDYDVISDPGQYYEAYYSQLYNKYFYGDGLTADAANLRANTTMLNQLQYNCYQLPDGENLIGLNGKLNPNATLGRTYTRNGETYYMTADDWQDAAYKTGLRQEYNVSAKGATDRSSFYLSMGYLNEEGVIDRSNYERISARIKADYQAKSWLKLGVNAQYVNAETKSNPNLSDEMNSTNLMYFTSSIAPIYPIYIRMKDADGNVYIKKDQYGHEAYDYGLPSGYGYSRPFLSTGNPLGSNRYNDVKSGFNQINASAFANVIFTDWLKLNITSTVIYGITDYSNYQNCFEGPKVGVNGELTKSNSSSTRTNNVQTLMFNKSFGKHNVDAMFGHEYYTSKAGYLAAVAEGGFSPDIKEIYAFAYRKDATSYIAQYNVEGWFGRAQYNFDDKYFGSFSYRRDASSRFAKENRWGNFWSLGAAWLVNKESFFNVGWVDELKVKASIGQQGNDAIGDYAFTDLYVLSKASNTLMSPTFYRKGNPEITWETTTNMNIGVEFSLLKRRITGSLDFYTKKTTDLLFWLSLPESQGTRGYYGNIGDIRNSGVELQLTGAIIRTRDIDWSVTANLSHNATKILKLPEQKIQQYGGFKESNEAKNFQYWYRENGPLYNAFLPDYAGVNEKGEALYWVDEAIDGNTTTPGVQPGKNHDYTTTNIEEASYYEQGSLLPKVFGGFSTSFRYKSFDFSATFDYQLGGKVYDQMYATLMAPAVSGNDAGSAIHKDVLKSWTPNNTSSDIPRWQYGDKYTTAKSNRFLTSASYLNFQSFMIGYTLPKGIIPIVSKVRFYCVGENLCFWSARKGLDPRYSYDGNGYTGVYSPTRNISGGIQVTF